MKEIPLLEVDRRLPELRDVGWRLAGGLKLMYLFATRLSDQHEGAADDD